jgi:HlyD family secretion protein
MTRRASAGPKDRLDDVIEVIATSQTLAHRIGHELKTLFRGRASYAWADDGALCAGWEERSAPDPSNRADRVRARLPKPGPSHSVPWRASHHAEDRPGRGTFTLMKRWRVWILLAIAMAGALVVLRVVPVLLGDRADTDTLALSGNIEAHESVVAFKAVQSRIVELPFDEGQWVEAGTLLARLDDADYRQQATIDDAAVRARRAELASTEQALEAARKTVLADLADRGQRGIDERRVSALWGQGVVSRDDFDRVTTALKQSDAILQRDRALGEARARDIEVARAGVRSAREQLRLARILLGYTVLRAPFAGVILVRQAELGEVMLPGTPVVTLADLDHVWLRAYVRETDLGRIRWGQAAVIRTDTYSDRRYSGRVSFISSKAEFTPKSVETHAERVTLVYRIRIDVENPAHQLKPGMPADAAIALEPAETHG